MADDLEQRIRERAHRIWVEEGCPEGREKIHWDMAAELVAIEDRQTSTLKPVDEKLGPWGEPIEPVEAAKATGEIPTLTDQGEGQLPAKPAGRKRATSTEAGG
jgi:hypothetical protein